MTNLVVDASAFIDYVLRTERGDSVAAKVEEADTALHSPELCDVEVVAGIRRTLVARIVDEERAAEGLGNYLGLPVRLYSHRWLLGRVLELRENVPPYDAMYVALAEAVEAPLLTTDGRLGRAARAYGRCEVVSVSP